MCMVMDIETDPKRSSILKKLEQYLWIGRRAKSPTKTGRRFIKRKSWHNIRRSSIKNRSKGKETPSGCFSVYVGMEKQRFVIKAELANHPLFKMLLEDAELEYGFNTEGPLLLPCEVDVFCRVLAEMGSEKEYDQHLSWELGYGSCSPFNPAERLGRSDIAKGYSSYGFLTPPRWLKIHHLGNSKRLYLATLKMPLQLI